MPTRNINLTDRYDKFVSEQINAGRFRSASEVLLAGLQLLENQTRENEQKLELMRALTAEAIAEIDQGRGIELNSRQEVKNLLSHLGQPRHEPKRTKRGR
jgi:antitoxin ParD1/3/4